jgi:putative SOS response-associated peptidase YedK
MCGRFTLHTPESRIREAFNLEQTTPLGLKPRYNIAPSQQVPIVRDTDTGREMATARWGLVPHWSKEPKTRYSTINARIESVAEKPAYRTPFKRQRCLIPADGFFEWKVVNGQKIPHHIRMRDGDVFALAGLWDRWEGDGESLESCSIIVMPANEVMKPLHERMPTIIAPAHYDLWLDSRVTDKVELMSYLNSTPSSQLVTYPISPWVNSPKHDDARCIEPAGSNSD